MVGPAAYSGGPDTAQGLARQGSQSSLAKLLRPASAIQARVALPACIVCVDAASVVARDGGALEAVTAAVAGGATAVLLADTGATGAPAPTEGQKALGEQGLWGGILTCVQGLERAAAAW